LLSAKEKWREQVKANKIKEEKENEDRELQEISKYKPKGKFDADKYAFIQT